MKKLLFLFTALLLISCSSEDDDSTQNFLEKYDGVYWASNDNDEGFWLQFNLTDFVNCDDDGVEGCDCDSVTWGGNIDYNTTVSVKENGVEKLVINYSAQIEDITMSFDINIKTINNGKGIEVLLPAGFEEENEVIETYTRFDSQPCN